MDALWRGSRALVEAAEPPKPNPRLRDLASIVGNDACTPCFLVALHGVFKPRLLEMYEDHARFADVVADAPTVRVLTSIIRDEVRQIKWGEHVSTRFGAERYCGREENIKRKSMADYLTAECGELV